MLKQATIGLFTLSLLLTGCGTPEATLPQTKLIVTTFLPYYVFTQNLVGNQATVINIINNTQEPHDYQLKPSDIITLQKADLIIRNGLGLDDWVAEAAQKSGTHAQILNASDNIETLAPQTSLSLDEDTSNASHSEHDSTFDPHIWVSPKNVLKILPHITDQLKIIDPTNSDAYDLNLQKYAQKITELDQDISQTLKPYTDKEFISFHEAFQYFARDYGLVSAIAIESYPGQEPTPRYLQALMKKIREKQIKTIFSEPQFSPRVVEVLANDLALKVYSLDPLETGIYSLQFYEENTRKNVQNMIEAFSL